MRRFHGAYLFSKSTNVKFKILIDCSVWRNDFEIRFYKNYSKTTKKKETQFLQLTYFSLEISQ